MIEEETNNNLFSEFEEDTVTIKQNLEESAKLKHEVGWYCWCYENKGYNMQSIEIHGFTCGTVWSNDGSIYCWLCMLDEIDCGAPIHHTVAPMYSNKDFTRHIVYGHISKPMSEYWPRLPRIPHPSSYDKRGRRKSVDER